MNTQQEVDLPTVLSCRMEQIIATTTSAIDKVRDYDVESDKRPDISTEMIEASHYIEQTGILLGSPVRGRVAKPGGPAKTSVNYGPGHFGGWTQEQVKEMWLTLEQAREFWYRDFSLYSFEMNNYVATPADCVGFVLDGLRTVAAIARKVHSELNRSRR